MRSQLRTMTRMVPTKSRQRPMRLSCPKLPVLKIQARVAQRPSQSKTSLGATRTPNPTEAARPRKIYRFTGNMPMRKSYGNKEPNWLRVHSSSSRNQRPETPAIRPTQMEQVRYGRSRTACETDIDRVQFIQTPCCSSKTLRRTTIVNG